MPMLIPAEFVLLIFYLLVEALFFSGSSIQIHPFSYDQEDRTKKGLGG